MFYRMMVFLSFFMFAASSAKATCTSSQSISGKVELNGGVLSNAKVKLFEIFGEESRLLEKTKTNSAGEYHISYQAKSKSLLYLLVRNLQRPEIVLIAAFENNSDSCRKVIINELTTVATAYSLAQFITNNQVFGPFPGIRNAVGTIGNLVDLSNGKPGRVISNKQNGAHGNIRSTKALTTQNTLANLISGCAADPAICEELFSLVSQDGKPVKNTFQAIHAIAKNPFVQDNEALFNLASQNEVFQPPLDNTPDSWALALHFVRGGFSAPGRMAFDSKGRVWCNNNWLPPAGSSSNIPGRQVTVLSPQGKPILNSPIFSKFVHGSGYGNAIDQKDRAWIASFNDGQIARFTPNGEVDIHSKGLNHPMSIALDQKGNLWIANMGDPGDPDDAGYVTVYIGGNPDKRIDHESGIFKPFGLAIDDKGLCWVANGAFTESGSVTILKLSGKNEVKVFKRNLTSTSDNGSETFPSSSNFASPLTVAIDQNGNGWVNNFLTSEVTFISGQTFEVTNFSADPQSHGWGLAVDGGGLVWSASFAKSLEAVSFQEPPILISVLSSNGNGLGNFLYSFTNSALQHATSLQIDSSGNVWVANNWALDSVPPEIIYSGDGLVEFIGIATPVVTPLIGQPVNPATLIKK